MKKIKSFAIMALIMIVFGVSIAFLPEILFTSMYWLAKFNLLGSKFNMRDDPYTAIFNANERYFAFVHRFPDRTRASLLYDTKDNKLWRLEAQSGRIGSPNFAQDGSLFIGVNPKVNPPYPADDLDIASLGESRLFSCEMSVPKCTSLFSYSGLISRAMENERGDIVFVSSQLEVRADPMAPNDLFLAYHQFDFFMHEKGRSIRRLTHSDAFELQSTSHGGDYLIMQIYHNRKNKRARDKRFTSKIYCARIDEWLVPIDFSEDTEKPCVSYGNKIDVKPSLSPGGKVLAILSVSSSKRSKKESGWVYEIIILDFESHRLIKAITPSEDWARSLSKPIFITNDRVRYMELLEDIYYLREYNISTDQITVIAEIDMQDIPSASDFIIDESLNESKEGGEK